MIPVQHDTAIEVEDLGLVNYEEAFRYQNACVEGVLHKDRQKLIFCEHPSVITLGRLAHRENILTSDQELKAKGIECIPINRGGDVTLHCPGQLVIYPILDLNNFGKDLKLYMQALEQVVIDALAQYHIAAQRVASRTGVWVNEKKIASLGIGVRKWISFHGVAINVSPDLSLFSLIRPCGMDVETTSMAELKGNSIDMQEIKRRAIASFSQNFNIAVGGCKP